MPDPAAPQEAGAPRPDPVTAPAAGEPGGPGVEPISDEALEKMTNEPGWRLNRTLWLALIARLRAAEAKVERFQMAGTLLDGQVRLGDHRVYRVADHWEGTIAGHRVALLIPLPDTPEEEDDG